MITTNPFSMLSNDIPAIAMQAFVIVMGLLVVLGTLVDIIHKKNVKYFFENAKKAKKSANKVLTTGEKTAVVFKTIASDIATTSELGAGKRRVAHLLGMYGTILFWLGSVVMDFLLRYTIVRHPISMANHMACWCDNDCSRRILVLVFFKS